MINQQIPDYRKRQTNPTVDKRGGSGYWFRAAQAVGVRSASF
jgi:hypothetical protein